MLFLLSCDQDDLITPTNSKTADTLFPKIVLHGKKNDTAYLYAGYRDPGASVVESTEPKTNCDNFRLVSEITGTVDTRLPGTYSIIYKAQDASGNVLSAVTRTVIVVENKGGFLNGNYMVACTCTAVNTNSLNPVITTANYTAAINSSSVNNQFDLSLLKVGPVDVKPDAVINGNGIELWFYHPDFLIGNGSHTGTLSTSKNTFTIESTVYQYSPVVRYSCKNIYSKQLILK